MNLAIVQYNAGNTGSVINALQRLGFSATITNDHDKLRAADKVIFPGVGAAGTAMQSLCETGLHELIPTLQQPVLGICVGMQLLCSHSEEGNTAGLGVVPLRVKKFTATTGHKVPQMGWNTLTHCESALFNGVTAGDWIYNVHSYYVEDSPYTIARCEYGLTYAAALRKENFWGVQFHTEKSAEAGDRILLNFLQHC